MPRYFLPSFKSAGLSVLEKKFKIDFQDGGHGGHLGFWIWTILALFDLQYNWPQYFQASLESVGLSVQEKFKIDFQDGGHLGFWIWMILAIFDLQVTPLLPTKFQVNWPFGSGEEAKNKFSRWQPWWPSWISDWNDFSYFWSASHPDASYQVSSQLAFWLRRSKKQIFKVGAMVAILDSKSEQFKHLFIYKSPRCFLPSFKSIGISIQEEQLKIYFPIGTILAIFSSTNYLSASNQVSSHIGLLVQEKKGKTDFQDGRYDFRSERF